MQVRADVSRILKSVQQVIISIFKLLSETVTQLAFTCSKLTMETLQKGVK